MGHAAVAGERRAPESGPAAAGGREAFDALPMTFEPNVGQTDARAKFVARSRGYAVFVTDREAVLSLGSPGRGRPGEPPGLPARRESLRMRVGGMHTGARPEAVRELPGRSNYFVGSDSGKWRRDVPTYAGVRFAGVYDGIDMVLYGTQQQLEYDFVVAPGADARQIRVGFDGARSMKVDENGDLVLAMRSGELRHQRAVVYQEVPAGKRFVGARYRMLGGGEVGFDLAGYDPARPLVIDPVLVFSDYLSGSASFDVANSVALDGAGNAYVAGQTFSVDFPTTLNAYDHEFGKRPGFCDAFAMKIAPSGAVLYSTYYGGLTSSTAATAVAVNASGDMFVAGWTFATDLPIFTNAFDGTANGRQDAFLARISPSNPFSGLVYATYLGGQGDDEAAGVAVGAPDVAYVVGRTTSFDFPTSPGAFATANHNFTEEGFAFAVDTETAARLYGTYLGGVSSDIAADVAVDGSGNAVVYGRTYSPDYPTTPGAYQTTPIDVVSLFVTKLNPSGTGLVFSTLFGGENFEQPEGLALDGAGNVCIAGYTTSEQFPLTPGAIDTVADPFSRDGFASKLSADGSSLLYSTYLGGEEGELIGGIGADSAGNLYVTGVTDSPDFPTTPGAFQTVPHEIGDAFVVKIDPVAGSLAYGTLLGGNGVERAGGIAVAPDGAATVVGWTSSVDFPTAGAASPSTLKDFGQAFVTRIAPSGASLQFSYSFGGVVGSQLVDNDIAAAVAVDNTGATYVVGYTQALNFPTTPGGFDTTYNYLYDNQDSTAYDAFVSKISPNASTLVYSTFLGSSSQDYARGVAVDANGNAYVVGQTDAGYGPDDFPTTPGALDRTYGGLGDAFVTKLSVDGSSLVYSTFLGGSNEEEARGVAVDASGAAYVSGTAQFDFPTTPGAYDTTVDGNEGVFAAKLAPSGASLVYSTYLGSTAEDDCSTIAVDGTGVAFVAGRTAGADYPATPGAYDTTFNGGTDAFVTALSPAGNSLVFSTFLGGTAGEQVNDLALDPAQAVYVTGTTSSGDFPATPGAYDTTYNEASLGVDAFVAKLSPGGAALAYGTYLGAGGNETATSIAVDAAGSAYVAGYTSSVGFPTTPDAFDRSLDTMGRDSEDAFFAEIDPSGGTLLFSTFLGGLNFDVASDVAVDRTGAAYVVGSSFSLGAFGFGPADDQKVFVMKIRVATGDSPGVYAAGSGAWFLRNANAAGPADLAFGFGPAGSLVPLAGDWDGDGDDTPGLYNASTGAFFLKNANSGGSAEVVFTFGAGGGGLVPLSGDWNGDGVDTVGLYSPSTGAFFLKNSNAGGAADLVFTFGAGGAGVVPLAGDWDGNGTDTVGLYATATGTFFLRNANAPGPADLAFNYGPVGTTPVRGDWDGDGDDTVGVYVPSTGAWFLRNSNSPGSADVVFGYGPGGVVPLAGDWDGL